LKPSRTFTPERRLDAWKPLILLAIIVLIALEIAVHWYLLPALERGRLFTVGGLAEISIWVLLLSALLGVHLRRLPDGIYGLLTSGLAVWLGSQTADLMDEFLVQPLWLSTYGEDIARVCGMLLVTLGLLGLIRHSASIMNRLEYLSFHDPLTGLFNRRMLQHQVDSMGATGFSLLLIDLDHFKTVNDRHGHEAGDALLRGLAGELRARLEGRAMLFRMGGEEFVVLHDSLDDAELERFADDMRRAIDAFGEAGGPSVTASVGAGARRAQESLGELMRRVDRALYAAKRAGRNRVHLAD
jgi:diguanylate cyclase (GGDEF)-like protein